MRNTSLIVFCGAVVLAAGCATPHSSDVTMLQGSWQGIAPGAQEHKCSFAIAGNRYEFHDETDTNVWYKGTFSLREDTMPRQSVFTIAECPFPQYVGKTSLAIYQMKDGMLTITGNEPGKTEVPVAFDAPEASRIELRRR